MPEQPENDPTPTLTPAQPQRSARRPAARLAVFGIAAALVAALFASAPTGAAPASAGIVSNVQPATTVTVASAKMSKAAKKKVRARAIRSYNAKVQRLAKKAPRAAAKKIMRNRGYAKRQQTCLVKLWNKESNWRWHADNPSSSAYGIPQALPGSKMRSAGKDWRTNPVTQIKWGLKYIKQRHGSPCGAWGHSVARGWY